MTSEYLKDSSTPVRERMITLIKSKQKEITKTIENIDGFSFQTDSWLRENNGGGGESMVLQNGTVFEKAGVNISIVHGTLPPQAVARMKNNHKNLKASLVDGSVNFFACGLSTVMHPNNPHVPTTHANYRYFETTDPTTGEILAWWFGGGADLTPYYLYGEDCKHFHRCYKNALDRFDVTLYPKYKKWCDEYFFIKHRNECRGIGGIFFDDFDDRLPNEILFIVESCLDAFMKAYVPIIELRKHTPYNEEEKNWQLIRRGRYVEFNLVLDRGTQFGLHTPGSRIESILMSLPTHASWVYNHHPEEGTREAELVHVLQNPINWID